MTHLRMKFLVAAALLLLSACAYQSGDLENPLTRRFTWFSYLGGEDLRAACRPGQPARFRLVYNGVYKEQVRAYDLRESATGSGAILFVRIFAGGELVTVGYPDPLAPGRGVAAETRLTTEEYGELVRALADNGAFAPPPEGLQLGSDEFYWVASACVDGRFRFHAWRYGSEPFAKLTLEQALSRFDRSGVAFNRPRPGTSGLPRPGGEPGHDFTMRVGAKGFVGTTTLF